jgi:UrcA family protein
MRRNILSFVLPVTVLLSPLCHAAPALQPGYEIVTRRVQYTDLNLDDNRAVELLYRRIKSAAVDVCEAPQTSRFIETIAHVWHCERAAVEEAVQEVNSPKLTELHRSVTNRVEIAMSH